MDSVTASPSCSLNSNRRTRRRTQPQAYLGAGYPYFLRDGSFGFPTLTGTSIFVGLCSFFGALVTYVGTTLRAAGYFGLLGLVGHSFPSFVVKTQ